VKIVHSALAAAEEAVDTVAAEVAGVGIVEDVAVEIAEAETVDRVVHSHDNIYKGGRRDSCSACFLRISFEVG
jgi:hypothetical protein